MKVNKIGMGIGLLVVASMFVFVVSIDAETMCEVPKVANTITDLNTSNIVITNGSITICHWISNDVAILDRVELPRGMLENV